MDSWAMAADVAIDSFQTQVTRQWSLLYIFLSIEDYLLLEHASNDMSALPAVSLWGQGMIEHKEQAEIIEKNCYFTEFFYLLTRKLSQGPVVHSILSLMRL